MEFSTYSSVNVSSLATFRRSIQDVDFTDFLNVILLIYGYVCYFTHFLNAVYVIQTLCEMYMCNCVFWGIL